MKFAIDQYLLKVYKSTPSTSICYNYTPVSFPTKYQGLRETCITAAILREPPVLTQPNREQNQAHSLPGVLSIGQILNTTSAQASSPGFTVIKICCFCHESFPQVTGFCSLHIPLRLNWTHWGHPVSSNCVLVQGLAPVLRLTQQCCCEGREKSEPANHPQADDLQLTWSNPVGQEKQDITAAQLLSSTSCTICDPQSTGYWNWEQEHKS